MVTGIWLLIIILPLTSSSMGGLVANSKRSISVASVVINAKGFQASVQKGQKLDRTPRDGRTRLQSPRPRELTSRRLSATLPARADTDTPSDSNECPHIQANISNLFASLGSRGDSDSSLVEARHVRTSLFHFLAP